jgi:hypothetical protein
MWLQRARRLGAAVAGAAATKGISGRTGARGGCYRGGGDEYGSAGMLRAGGGAVGAGQGPGVPASETDPPPSGGLSFAREGSRGSAGFVFGTLRSRGHHPSPAPEGGRVC